jgi:hypothetical protein
VENPPADPLPQVEKGAERVLSVGAHVHSSCTVTHHKHALGLEDEWLFFHNGSYPITLVKTLIIRSEDKNCKQRARFCAGL